MSGAYPAYFSTGSTIETGVRRKADSIDIFYRVDGYNIGRGKSDAVFRVPWQEGQSLLPALAGGINFGHGWDITVDFDVGSDFKELLGLSAPPRAALAWEPAAKRQRAAEKEVIESASRTCSACGHVTPPENKFCGQCGHNLDNEKDVEVIGFSIDGEQAHGE